FMVEDINEVSVNIIGGTSQDLGTNFYVQDNKIKWDGLDLEGEIHAGDMVRVIYMPHGLSGPARVKFVLENNTLTILGVINGHYENLMKRILHSPVVGPWNTSFYMDTVPGWVKDNISYNGNSVARGYVSRFLAIAESINNTDLAKPYAYKTWRQPIILHG
ncbi:MAG: hypothetical protein IMZ64_13285, partial [Bacteroidetes bacterium]|nr:hypothetical protein [Bacteroidota bacterium]